MSLKKLNIALFAPSNNQYSETFIQAHKNNLDGNVFYYYGTGSSIRLDRQDSLMGSAKYFRLKLYAKLNKKPSNYLWEQRLVYSLKSNKIDVILVEYGNHAHQLRKVLMVSGLPIVVHFHGYDASVRSIIESCENYKQIFQISNKIVAVSRKMEQMLLDMGCPREKLVHNVCGPQLEFEAVVPTFENKQFIGIGRFTDKKAPYYTILAFKEVVEKHPDARLLLAGDGLLFNSCQNIIKHYHLEDNVKLLGVIKPEEFRGLLEVSLAFVQHSITADNGDMEGTPVAVLEASVAGLPVISTFHAGIPDVINHEDTGLLSQEHDVAAMAANMLRLLDDVELAKKLGIRGKKNIFKNFSFKTHIDRLQLALQRAIETNKTN